MSGSAAVDPKYASLPGIARDQPDVYETSDLPESEQQVAAVQAESVGEGDRGIDRTSLQPDKAYSAFRGKYVDNSGADFSDSIGYERNAGYQSTGRWHAGGGETESPRERFERLRSEIAELQEDVSAAAAASSNQQQGAGAEDGVTANQIAELGRQLADAHIEQVVGAHSLPLTTADPSGAVQRRLLSHIQGLTAAASAASAEERPQKKGDSGELVQYELMYRPDQARFMAAAQLAALEERVAALERLTGAPQGKPSGAVSLLPGSGGGPGPTSLSGAVAYLESRVAVLDPGQLELIEPRLHLTNQRLNQIAERAAAVEENDQRNKVCELYELLDSHRPTLASLPSLRSRLTSLRSLHEQALQMSGALAHLDTVQQRVEGALHSDREMLAAAREGFERNTRALQGACDTIQGKVERMARK